MNHEEAIKTMAAERYILDELEPAERDAFEDHFFDCTDCTADVRDAAKVADGMRTAIRVVPVKHYSRWAAAAAGAVVAIGLAYQYVPQVAGLRHHPANPLGQVARVTASEQVIELAATRAGKPPFIIVDSQPVSLRFIIPVTDPHPPYDCELHDEAGRFVGAKRVMTKEEAAEAVTMLIRPGKLHSGNYILGIRGDREIPAYHFAVEVK